MSNWIRRVGALFGARPAVPAPSACAPHADPPAALARPTPASPPATEVFVESMLPDMQVPFFEWLLDAEPSPEQPLTGPEKRLLSQLDGVLAADGSRADLLPRAPAVIPQLMNSLRDESQSNQGLADRIAKDPNLVAEVLRLANSSAARASEPVSDLAQAVSRLGTQGLRRAIAKVVLKPIFDAQPDTLSGRAAPRLWLHSEAKAAECLRLAVAVGLDSFEGYLAGLMHNIGWTAALRALDRIQPALPPGGQPRYTRAFVEALDRRRETFFALLVMPWQLTDSLTALAVELLDGGGLNRAASPLAQALLAADRSAALDMLGAGATLESMRVAPLAS